MFGMGTGGPLQPSPLNLQSLCPDNYRKRKFLSLILSLIFVR